MDLRGITIAIIVRVPRWCIWSCRLICRILKEVGRISGGSFGNFESLVVMLQSSQLSTYTSRAGLILIPTHFSIGTLPFSSTSLVLSINKVRKDLKCSTVQYRKLLLKQITHINELIFTVRLHSLLRLRNPFLTCYREWFNYGIIYFVLIKCLQWFLNTICLLSEPWFSTSGSDIIRPIMLHNLFLWRTFLNIQVIGYCLKRI